MKYAQNTRVSEESSRAEVERTIRKYVGRDAELTYGRSAGRAAVQFAAHGRRVRFDLPLASEAEARAKAGRKNSRRSATEAQVRDWLVQEDRRRWRCLLLVVKAKFAAVEVKLELAETEEDRLRAFDEEFLAYFVSSGGRTLYEVVKEAEVGGERLLGPVPPPTKVEHPRR